MMLFNQEFYNMVCDISVYIIIFKTSDRDKQSTKDNIKQTLLVTYNFSRGGFFTVQNYGLASLQVNTDTGLLYNQVSATESENDCKITTDRNVLDILIIW